MPEIPVQGDRWSDLLMVVIRLCLDPSSLEATNDIESSWEGFALHGLLRHFGGDVLQVTQENLILLGKGRPDRVPLGIEAEDLAYGLLTAGHVLTYVLRLKQHLPVLASAESAFKIVSARYVTEERPASLTSIKEAWRKYRPVAQFVAALPFAWETLQKMKGVYPDFPGLPKGDETEVTLGDDYMLKIKAKLAQIESNYSAGQEVWAEYFGYAEALRKRGTAHFAPNQERKGRPLLDPETAWSVPARFAVSAVSLSFPDLDAAERHSAAGVN